MHIVKMFEKKKRKIIKSYTLDPEVVETIDKIAVIHQVSRSQVLSNVVMDYANSFYHHTIQMDFAGQVKKRPRFSGHAYSDPSSKEFECKVKKALKLQWLSAPLSGMIAVSIDFKFSAPKKAKNPFPGATHGDADNLAKAILDISNKILWVDDRQVIDLRVTKVYSAENSIVIKFSEIEIDDKKWVKTSSGYFFKTVNNEGQD